jgi:hypothetical protein
VFNVQYSITSSNQSLEVNETALDLPNHGNLSIPGRVLCRCEALFSPIGRYDTSVSGWTITDYLVSILCQPPGINLSSHCSSGYR